ncbi:hypothetical protein PPYR_00512 [Photinus pyralis]|uniref:Uncharacterized protein n=1 Tax=Photinus pyralis TaxID=7054 RepID=A0A5N4B1R6_PHOPY|nr:hypothetical protein PPYR_00512 [Photinus pyralis]
MSFLSSYIMPRKTTLSNVKGSCSATPDVWDTMNALTEQSESGEACSGASEASSRGADIPPEQEMASRPIESASSKRKGSQMRTKPAKKANTDVDVLLTDTLVNANLALTREDDEDMGWGSP